MRSLVRHAANLLAPNQTRLALRSRQQAAIAVADYEQGCYVFCGLVRHNFPPRRNSWQRCVFWDRCAITFPHTGIAGTGTKAAYSADWCAITFPHALYVYIWEIFGLDLNRHPVHRSPDSRCYTCSPHALYLTFIVHESQILLYICKINKCDTVARLICFLNICNRK